MPSRFADEPSTLVGSMPPTHVRTTRARKAWHKIVILESMGRSSQLLDAAEVRISERRLGMCIEWIPTSSVTY